MRDLAKISRELESIRNVIASSDAPDIEEGAIFIDKEGSYHKVIELKVEKVLDHDTTRERYKSKHGKDAPHYLDDIPKKEKVFKNDVRVFYITNYAGYAEPGEKEWDDSKRNFLLSEFLQQSKSWVKVGDMDAYQKLALDAIEGKAELPDPSEVEQFSEASTDLIHVGSKEFLFAMQEGAREKMQHFRTIQHMVKRELEIRKDKLAKIADRFRTMVDLFKDKVRRIQKIIDTIELYLGIHETILQIQEGPKATVDDPITFRQRILFMDEEVGDPRLDKYGDNEGLDFMNIEAFDDWLCANENYKKVIPEQKCVCIFKVRRHTKQGHWHASGGNPFIASMMEAKDKKTYVLIRNGDSLYRIWTNLEVGNRLFPHKKELIELQEKVIQSNSGYYYEKAKEELESTVDYYRRQFIMMQGLIDRTEILRPLKEVFKLSELDIDKTDLVRYIYDDEGLLTPKDHIPFEDWVKKVNSTIREGTRVLLVKSAPSGKSAMGRYDERYRGNWDSDYTYSLPDPPNQGLYIVRSRKDERGIKTPWCSYDNKPKEVLCLYYNPGGTITNWWDRYDTGHDRKNNVSYIINPEYDNFLLNLDAITTKEIDYYLDSRIDRHEYLWMMPMLWEARQFKKKEEDEEHDFLLMVIAQFTGKHTQDELMPLAKEAMVWWKLKNKWKRGLKSDDSKAFRMISSKLKKDIKS